MVTCPKCGFQNDDNAINCTECHVNIKWAYENTEQLDYDENMEKFRAEIKHLRDNLILTTTYSIDGRKIIDYLDVISAEVVLGIGLLSEFGAGVADILGTRASKFQEKLQSAKETAITELKDKAIQLNADGIVGASISFMTLANNMIMVTATGTAVKLETTG